MKNKPLTIVLIVAVVCIWAWIMFSIFDFMKSPAVVLQQKTKSVQRIVKDDSLIVEYVLRLNYKDPFLKNVYTGRSTNIESNKSSGTTPQSYLKDKKTVSVKNDVVSTDPIPTIHYAGRIQNVKLKKPIAILMINNNEFMMQEGESQDGILLTKILNDSIKVQFSKKIFYVKKN